jgi:hypothetical protein
MTHGKNAPNEPNDTQHGAPSEPNNDAENAPNEPNHDRFCEWKLTPDRTICITVTGR